MTVDASRSCLGAPPVASGSSRKRLATMRDGYGACPMRLRPVRAAVRSACAATSAGHGSRFQASSASKMLTPSRSSRARPREAAADPTWWLARHLEAFNHYRILHPADEAARLAWGEVEHRWHMAQGERVQRNLCVGCRRPINSIDATDLIDGNRVRAGELDCLIRHGERWRHTATTALVRLGLTPPLKGDVT
jgi:hypothetical protein